MIYKVSKWVWAPILALATFGTYSTWHEIYDVMWDVRSSTVVFAGIMFAAQNLDWWLRWLEYKNNH